MKRVLLLSIAVLSVFQVAVACRVSLRIMSQTPVQGIEEARKLIEVTRQAFFEGLRFAKPGYRISDIGGAVQEYAEAHGYSVVREYVGHGVGRTLHEAPEVPNFRPPRRSRPDPRLVKGMTIAVEPMVNMGACEVRVLANDWTVVTRDGSWAAHYENSILITDGDPVILTAPEE